MNHSKLRLWSVYGLSRAQLHWSSAKLKRLLGDTGYAKRARAYIYAELLRRRTKSK